MDQSEKCEIFRELHKPRDPFIMPNAWDAGSAKMLAAMGAKAIATTSAGFAFTIGKPDMGHVSRDEMLDHCEDIVRAVDLPVQGDLENGYAHDPNGVAECIELAGEVGLAGACIEDSTFEDGKPSYDFEIAVARIAAAVEAAEALPYDFTLTARADGVMIGSYDVEEAIRRIQAFEEVGAHCVYLPLPPTMADIETICASVSIPVNVLCAGRFTINAKRDFAMAGAARISVGSALARATHRVILEAGHAMLDEGDFTHLSKSVSGAEIDRMLKESS